jgi:hypothetical protein
MDQRSHSAGLVLAALVSLLVGAAALAPEALAKGVEQGPLHEEFNHLF